MRLSDTVSKHGKPQYFNVIKIDGKGNRTIITRVADRYEAMKLRDLHRQRLAPKGYSVEIEPTRD
jgi:hypothetical protein